jgi:hypothetical protein
MRGHKDEVDRLDSILKKNKEIMMHAINQQTGTHTKTHAQTIKWDDIDQFFQHSLLLQGDKDGSLVAVSKDSYLATVRAMLSSSHPRLREPNYLELDPNHRNWVRWEQQGMSWQQQIETWLVRTIGRNREGIRDQLKTFLRRQPPPKLPTFYLLAKTHKLQVGKPWGGRPIVAMSRWCTTGSSKILGTLAQLLLRLDGKLDPLRTPLQDAMEFTQRMQRVLTEHPNLVATTVDFESLYTNITESDALNAVTFWQQRVMARELPIMELKEEEISLVETLLTRVPADVLEDMEATLFLNNAFSNFPHTITLAHMLMVTIFRLSIFVAPGIGIFRQLNGFAMGTNCAPAWANAILRMYEIRGHNELVHFPLYSRYIDDICILHSPTTEIALRETIATIYPEHLPLTVAHFGSYSNIRFLDLLILGLYPLTFCVGWKETHRGTYIPWSSNCPRVTKLAWIRGETIRMLRLSSREDLFEVAQNRLHQCLQRLGYPKHTYNPSKVKWENREHYLKYREKTDKVVHLLRVPFHQNLPIPWGPLTQKLATDLALHPTLKPNQQLYVSLKAPPTIQRILHNKMLEALGGRRERRIVQIESQSEFIRTFGPYVN